MLSLSLVSGLAVWGCSGEDGVTPTTCPPLPLYDINDGTRDDGLREDAAERRAIQDAVDANCLSPIGTALSGSTTTAPGRGGGTSTFATGGAGGADSAGGAGGGN